MIFRCGYSLISSTVTHSFRVVVAFRIVEFVSCECIFRTVTVTVALDRRLEKMHNIVHAVACTVIDDDRIGFLSNLSRKIYILAVRVDESY